MDKFVATQRPRATCSRRHRRSSRSGSASTRAISFVGLVGEDDAKDFTALGDAVNATSRLSGLAAAGELLLSAAAAAAAGLDTAGIEHRCLELRGRDETLDAYVAVAAG